MGHEAYKHAHEVVGGERRARVALPPRKQSPFRSADWSYEEDCILTSLRDFSPERTYQEVALEIWRQCGVRRTPTACIGRYARLVMECEAALTQALYERDRRVERNKQRVLGPPITDPYKPRPDFFEVPTPVEKAYDFRVPTLEEVDTIRKLEHLKKPPQVKLQYRTSWT
jgi:hypothetical protein